MTLSGSISTRASRRVLPAVLVTLGWPNWPISFRAHTGDTTCSCYYHIKRHVTSCHVTLAVRTTFQIPLTIFWRTSKSTCGNMQHFIAFQLVFPLLLLRVVKFSVYTVQQYLVDHLFVCFVSHRPTDRPTEMRWNGEGRRKKASRRFLFLFSFPCLTYAAS